MPITYTPLRFPGGKTKIYPLVEAVLDLNGITGCAYSEPFCGGAGLATKLLVKGKVSKIILNDADPAIYSVWDVIVHHADDLCDFIETVPLSIPEWHRQREIYLRGMAPSYELGKAAFYLNRTNRSGMLEGGVIGGQSQNGRYKIDARFNRSSLISKVRSIGSLADSIEIYNLDVSEFLENVAAGFSSETLLYLDPPYVAKGPGLYKSSFNEEKHRSVAADIKKYSGKWMLTYDDNELVRQLYTPSPDWPIAVGNVSVRYSATTERKRASEFLALGPGLLMPEKIEK